MSKPKPPLFLEREPYRRRRLTDGARFLPILGFVLILLPALWTRGTATGTTAEAIYIFGLWILLIVAAALLSRPLRSIQDRGEGTGRPAPEARNGNNQGSDGGSEGGGGSAADGAQ
tara:strand:+ start:26208 stop:26555 length:348 start_codon:yes stop_codon:yes gene_type:complete